jgi:hypothetical protein
MTLHCNQNRIGDSGCFLPQLAPPIAPLPIPIELSNEPQAASVCNLLYLHPSDGLNLWQVMEDGSEYARE